MANVFFRRGEESALKTATYVDGCFYLTTDTHRLYVGEGGSIVPVNEGVTVVAAVSNLPAPGDSIPGHFYYATSENVLCVFNGSKWVQINPDTYVSGFETIAAASSNVATVTQTIKQTGQVSDPESTSFKVQGNDLKVEVDTTDKTKVILTGDKNDISIAAGETNEAKIVLGSTLFEDDSVNIKGSGAISVASDGDTITIGTTGLGTASEDIAETGHTFDFDANGNLVLKLKRKGSDEIEVGTQLPTLTYGSGDVAKFLDGNATLNVYSKTQIDEQFKTKLNALNAVVYKGSITALPTANVSNGNMYLVGTGASISVDGETAKAGDLVIAEGSENAEGIITGTITWTLIPSANEVDTKYELKTDSNKIILDASTGDDSEITVSGDKNVDLTAIGDKLTVSHKGPDTTAPKTATATPDSAKDETQSAEQPLDFDVVDSVTIDGTGHVIGVKTKTITVKDTAVDGVAESYSVSAADGTATISHTTQVQQNDTNDISSTATSFAVGSDNLTVSASGTKVTMNLEWGSF